MPLEERSIGTVVRAALLRPWILHPGVGVLLGFFAGLLFTHSSFMQMFEGSRSCIGPVNLKDPCFQPQAPIFYRLVFAGAVIGGVLGAASGILAAGLKSHPKLAKFVIAAVVVLFAAIFVRHR